MSGISAAKMQEMQTSHTCMGWRWFLSYYSLTELCDWTTDYNLIDYEQLLLSSGIVWWTDNIQIKKGHMQQILFYNTQITFLISI